MKIEAFFYHIKTVIASLFLRLNLAFLFKAYLTIFTPLWMKA